MLSAVTDQHPWHWQPHPEVWLLVGLVIALGFYVDRVIAPTMVAAGEAPITRRQKCFFWAGVLVLWVASDWPVHDIGEQYLFSVHMIQHLVLSFVLPPLFLFSIPTWLARLVIGRGRVGRVLVRILKPVVAGLAFNLFVALSHWAVIINFAVTSGPYHGPFHFALHVTLVLLATFMWMPICGPLPELRLPPLVQCAYLFLMSVIPTIPAAWLTFAENPVYSAYDRPYRLWGISVIQDQQAAGLLMKLGGSAYLWTLIIIIFFRWAARNQAEEARRLRDDRRVRQGGGSSAPDAGRDADLLTWAEVDDEFQRLGPPMPEASVRGPAEGSGGNDG